MMESTFHKWALNAIAAPNPTPMSKLAEYKQTTDFIFCFLHTIGLYRICRISVVFFLNYRFIYRICGLTVNGARYTRVGTYAGVAGPYACTANQLANQQKERITLGQFCILLGNYI